MIVHAEVLTGPIMATALVAVALLLMAWMSLR